MMSPGPQPWLHVKNGTTKGADQCPVATKSSPVKEKNKGSPVGPTIADPLMMVIGSALAMAALPISRALISPTIEDFIFFSSPGLKEVFRCRRGQRYRE